MATVNLGSIKFNWQGAYDNATAYAVDDVVSSNGSSYICIAATTGNTPPNATYWEQMSAKGTDGTNGTNGTDLGTVLTTQGDLVYRDGSGLQRLGAGTSGQVLQTGGAGANPSWTDLSSDYVLLATQTASSSSTISFDGYFSATYTNYKVIWNSVKASSSNYFTIRFRQSNADATATSYKGGFIGQRQHTDGSGFYLQERNTYHVNYTGGVGADRISVAYDDVASAENNDLQMAISSNTSMNGSLFLYDPLATQHHYANIEYFYRATGNSWNGAMTHMRGGIVYENTTALSGITFYPSTGTLSSGTFKLYGLK